MITELGQYEPFGKQFLEKRPHLGEDSGENPILDFSCLNDNEPIAAFHKLFNISESLKINVGNRLDERYPIQTGSIENPAISAEQEVYVQGAIVVWSRAGYVMKTFDYSNQDQPILQVLFAWFPMSSEADPINKPAENINLSDLGGDKYLEEGYWDKRGPQSIINYNKTKEEDNNQEDPPSKKSTRLLDTNEQDQSSQLQRRALCIVFQNFIKIHYEDGFCLTAHVPFEIGQVLPLDKGIIVSREYIVESGRLKKGKNRAGSITKLASMAGAHQKSEDPMFYTVTHPYKGPCPVKIKEITLTSTSKLPESLMISQELLFATAVPSEIGSSLILVTINKREHKHYIWEYDRRKNNGNINLSSKNNDMPYSQLPNKRKINTTYVNRRKYSKSILDAPNKKSKTKMMSSPSRPNTHLHEEYISDEEIPYENELEKEIYYELLDTSEISLKLLWRETHNIKVSTKLKILKNVKSEVFLVHGLSGEELICIMNYTLGNLQLINPSKKSSDPKEGIEFSVPARSAIPIYATRDTYMDLLYIDLQGKPQLYIDSSIPTRNITLRSGAIVKLMDPVYDRCTAVYENGDMYRFQLNLRPDSMLVRDCFSAIGCAATFFFPHVWSAYLDRQSKMEEWEAFFITLLSFLRLKKRSARHYYLPSIQNEAGSLLKSRQIVPSTRILTSKEIKTRQVKLANMKLIQNEMGFAIPESQQSDFLLNEAYREGVSMRWIDEILNSHSNNKFDLTTFSDIIRSLHVVYEDYRIKKSTAVHANRLGYLLMQSVVIIGNNDWINYYESCGVDPNFAANLQLAEYDMHVSIIKPPNLQVYLRQMTLSTNTPQVLLSYFDVSTLDPALGFCQNTYAITMKNLSSLYGAINDSSGDKSLLLERMVAQRITRRDIIMLNDTITIPILTILDELKQNPDVNWTKEAYNIIGRDDIYKQLQMDVAICDPNTDTFKLPFQKDSDIPKSMTELMKEYSKIHVNKCIYETDVLNMETERLRFGFGGVIEKVRIMLDSTKTPELYVPESPDKTDEEIAAEHQHQLHLLLQRTYALSVGRAIYAFGTHVPDLTKVMPIEPLNTSAKILPLRTIVNIDESVLTDELTNWPAFHNGVATGLRISPSNHINHSWIDFCNPPDLKPKHGGVLLAMGLNGVLKKLPLLDYYRFMTQSCELALIGFILAASVAYRGTTEAKITKVLSVYIPALLLPESASFNHSNLIKATALMGMGLNFMNSCDRQMASSMLKEIAKNAYSDPSMLEPNYEGCALAAGFSLGFITLGVGDHALDVVDKELTNKLYNLMRGRSTVSITESVFAEEKEEPRSINLDVTSPGATIALGLMYLKTENTKVAEAIEIPKSRPYLNYIRPDFLLLRVLSKNLIMWSTIQPTEEWIDSQLPEFITSNEQNGSFNHSESTTEEEYQNMLIDDEVIKQATYYIICGACFSMGLRFAGSRNKDAFEVLLNRLDFFMKLQLVQETTPQQHITKCIVRTCVDVVCTATAMVMAGTGNRDLISRLDQLNSRVTLDMNYGDHMAVSMSLGLLFIGLGGYTLSTTNESIAGLLCAFYPFYPITTEDNRYHLQAFRHLWVLAVDSRWLMPFDVEDEKPCRVPMYLELYDDDGSQAPASQRKIRQVRIEAPTVVPDYKLIKSIQLDGERYWPLFANMTENGRYQNSIIRSGLIYVKRKENKKSYEDDPTGIL